MIKMLKLNLYLLKFSHNGKDIEYKLGTTK